MKNKYRFNAIVIFPVQNFNTYKNMYIYSKQLIPAEWQLLLMSNGSFTQNLNSLTNQKNKININYKIYYTKLKQRKRIREIVMQDDYNNNLAFAQSLWQNNKKNIFLLNNNLPIGQLLIESNIDIYKEVHEVYYGYSIYLKEIFQNNHAIWGRKYTLYCKNEPVITIKEFFSPQLIHFFNLHNIFKI